MGTDSKYRAGDCRYIVGDGEGEYQHGVVDSADGSLMCICGIKAKATTICHGLNLIDSFAGAIVKSTLEMMVHGNEYQQHVSDGHDDDDDMVARGDARDALPFDDDDVKL